jgi:hypothetical protein
MYKALLVLHLVGVFLIVGGAGLATAIGIKMSSSFRRSRPETVRGLRVTAGRVSAHAR